MSGVSVAHERLYSSSQEHGMKVGRSIGVKERGVGKESEAIETAVRWYVGGRWKVFAVTRCMEGCELHEQKGRCKSQEQERWVGAV